MTEQWKDIPGYEGYYQVSDQGRVLSLDRVLKNGAHWKGRILKPSPDKDGYLIVSLYGPHGQNMRRVHRLVAVTFIGPCFPNMEVCHNDGTTNNNQVNNLRYDTCKGNHADKLLHGTDDRGEKSVCAKLTNEQVSELFDRIENGETRTEIAKSFGVSLKYVSMITMNKSWVHHPDRRYIKPSPKGRKLSPETIKIIKVLYLKGASRNQIVDLLKVGWGSVYKYTKGLTS